MRPRPFLSSVVLALVLLVPLLAAPLGAAAAPRVRLDPALKVHPLLQVGAQLEPDKRVRVIVQKADKKADKRGIVATAGAAGGEEVGRSVVLEVAQRRVLKLAERKDVLYVSPDLPVKRHGAPPDPAKLRVTYPVTAGADRVWTDRALGATGAGVTVAVLDTGFTPHPDLGPGNVTTVITNPRTRTGVDPNGHGTHIAGIVTGRHASGSYVGVAPDAAVIMVKIADDTGLATSADLMRGLQWVYDNRVARNIRVVSLSVTAGYPESYMTSPIAAAVEQLWFAGVTVVVAAGNDGAAEDAVQYAPANDPYVITVGCLDDNATTTPSDDSLCSFSSRGLTQDGQAKPDLVAPGRKVVSTLARTGEFAREFPDRVVDGTYVRMSGTSMATPVVAGTVALLLERYPRLTPDQIKWLLTTTERAYAGQADEAGALDAHAAMLTAGGAVGQANQGLTPSVGMLADDGTVSWEAGKWSAGKWSAGKWSEVYWEAGKWSAVTWVSTTHD
jgi:serine protease AprX